MLLYYVHKISCTATTATLFNQSLMYLTFVQEYGQADTKKEVMKYS
jgi:hypothetical protein